MLEIEKPRIECVNLDDGGSYGRFVIEPLDGASAPPWGIPCAGCSSPPCLGRR
jgi:hypothetical protein